MLQYGAPEDRVGGLSLPFGAFISQRYNWYNEHLGAFDERQRILCRQKKDNLAV